MSTPGTAGGSKNKDGDRGLKVDGRRVSCWWCDGDLERHPDRDEALEDWELVDDTVRLVDLLRCRDCGAMVMVFAPKEDGPRDGPDAPYDRNRCPRCGGYAVWQSDFNYYEVYGEGDGLVSYLACQRCGADLEYSMRDGEEDVDTDDGRDEVLDQDLRDRVPPGGGPDPRTARDEEMR